MLGVMGVSHPDSELGAVLDLEELESEDGERGPFSMSGPKSLESVGRAPRLPLPPVR